MLIVEDSCETPIVAFTGFTENAARVRAEPVGSDGFIAKPCRPSRLVEEVRRWLDPEPYDVGHARMQIAPPAARAPPPRPGGIPIAPSGLWPAPPPERGDRGRNRTGEQHE